jgi:hypothetical protein
LPVAQAGVRLQAAPAEVRLQAAPAEVRLLTAQVVALAVAPQGAAPEQ